MKQRITLIVSFFLLQTCLLAAPYLNLLDTALAANTNIFLSQTGQATIAIKPAQYNALTDSVYISQKAFDCADIAPGVLVFVKIYNKTTTPPVKWLDKITVIHPKDTSAPVVLIKAAHTLYLKPNGTAVLNFADIDLGTWDSCGLNYNGFKVLSKTNYTCADIGTTSMVMSMPDFHGNLTTKSILITVVDTLPPVLNLKNYPLNLNGAGSTASLTFANINNTSTDNCALGTATLNGAAQLTFSCADTGSQKIVVVLNDMYGNSTKDSIYLYVTDTKVPTYTKTPYTATLLGDSVTITQANILTNVAGGCYPAVVTFLDNPVFTCANTKSNPNYIAFSVTNGNKTVVDSVAITVVDATPPSLSLKSDTLILVSGSASLTFANVANTFADNCGIDSALVNGASQVIFTCADTGSQQVIVKLFDVNGNFKIDTANVFVADTVSPQYTKTPFTASLLTNSVAVSRGNLFSNVSAGCFAPSLVFTSDTVFTCADVSTNPQFVRFTFSSGTVNIADSVAVTVIDTVKPSIVLQADTVALVNGMATLTFATIDGGTADNCGIDSTAVNGASQVNYTCADVGLHKIVVLVIDENGNQNTDSINVFVADTIMPQYTKTPVTVYVNTATVAVSRAQILSNIVGGCAVPTLTFSSDTVFDCADIAQNPNYINFTLTSGQNVVADSVAVTVLDTLSPVLSIKPDTVFLQPLTASVTFANINNGSADNCGIDSATVNGASQITFNCANLGVQNVNVVLFDVHGNSSTGTISVFVADTISPTLALKSDTLILVNGTATLTFANINNGSADNCGIDSATVNGQNQHIFSCANAGIQTVQVTVYDASGNAKTGSVNVFVADTIMPQYTKTPVTVYVNTATVAVSRAQILSNIVGGCAVPTLAITSDTVFGCAAVAQNPNYISFTLSSGQNMVADSVAVTVLDTLAPTLLLTADTLILVNNLATLTFANINNGSSDNCALDSATLNGASQLNYTCADSGMHQILVVLFDEHGNSVLDSVTVFVADTISPSYTKTAFTANLIADSVVVSRANFLSNVAAGCFVPTVALLSDTVFYCTDVFTNPHYLKFTVNTGSVLVLDSVAVTVVDAAAPSLMLKSDTLILQNGTATVTFANVNNASSDNCGLDSALVNGFSAITFTCATAGPSKIGVTLFDVSGNFSHDSVVVYIQDSVPPTYTKTPITVNLVGNSATVSRADILSNISGGCSQPFLTLLSDTVFSCENAVSNPNYVVFKIMNGGITVTDSVAVTVADVTPPSMTLLPPPILVLGANGTRVLTYADLLSAAPTDNCGVDSVHIVPAMLTCSNTQAYSPIIITVFDASGNYDTKSTFALAVDNKKPTLVAKNDTIYVDSATGQQSIVLADLVDTAYDACGINTITLSKTLFSCADVGPQTVTITASDFTGNIAVLAAGITVLDTTKPSVQLAISKTIFLNTAGVAGLSVADVITAPIFDNCGIASTSLSKSAFTCADLGYNTIVVSATDTHGNTQTKSLVVFVMDDLLPSITTQNIAVAIDTITKMAVVSPWQLITSAGDNCGFDSASASVTPNQFTCANIGQNTVVVTLYDNNGNFTQATAIVTILAATIGQNLIEGPMQVCGNTFNVKYSVKDFKENSEYFWSFNPAHAEIISTSYRGREIYVHWRSVNTSSIISVSELNLLNCGTSVTDTLITINGTAPDTAAIVFWNSVSQSTLVSTDTVSSYFQWGFDEVVAGNLVSSYLVGETKNSYHNPAIATNIATYNYRYWCETSFNGSCWNRSYFNNMYPVDVPELNLNDVKLWPNPFTNQIGIKSTSPIVEVSMVDMLGKIVYKQRVEKQTEIALQDFEALPAAAYIVTIICIDGSINKVKIMRAK